MALLWQIYFGRVSLITDKTEYAKKETLRITIKNNLKRDICFSSCYPYYLEKKEEKSRKWKPYPYGECGTKNLVEKCLESGGTKIFELNLLLFYNTGSHRIAVPVCFDCKPGEDFKESKRFYSNKFTIK